MANIILVMGLPGSGKSTLSNKLAQKIGADHFRSDEIRAKYNDCDFSESGRRRQAERMKKLGDESRKTYAICDFICPFKEGRKLFNPDILILMNTIKQGRFKNFIS